MVDLEIERAQKIFSQIPSLYELCYWDNIANRIYYSVFHAVSALLICNGYPVGTHKGAVIMFGLHFVKTGIFSSEDGKLYSQLQSMREQSDYNLSYDVDQRDIDELLQPAETLLHKIISYINDR